MDNKITKKKLREFGFVIGFGFPMVIGYIIPAIYGHGFRFWTIWIGFIGFFIALIRPTFLRLPYKGWMFIGHKLGWINSFLILGLIFLFVLQPIALIMRLFGYDPLKLRKRVKETTYRENFKNHKIDLNRIF